MTTANTRTSDHEIDPLFLERWSPRAFDEQALTQGQIQQLIEAARWAPSAYNSQPWRFLYALRGSADWNRFLSLLIPFNQSWAERAGALVILVSAKTMLPPGKTDAVPSHSHSVDAGAAWGQFALQATKMGLQAHGMTGFDIARAAEELKVPENFRVEIAIAVGKPGDKSVLPDGLAAREAPSGREPLSKIAFAGNFQG